MCSRCSSEIDATKYCPTVGGTLKDKLVSHHLSHHCIVLQLYQLSFFTTSHFCHYIEILYHCRWNFKRQTSVSPLHCVTTVSIEFLHYLSFLRFANIAEVPRLFPGRRSRVAWVGGYCRVLHISLGWSSAGTTYMGSKGGIG